MKEIRLEFQGQNYLGQAEKVNGLLWVHLEGKTFCFADAEVSFRPELWDPRTLAKSLLLCLEKLSK